MRNKKYKNQKENNKNNNKPRHNKSENLSTSIGDLLKAKGMLLPNVENVDEVAEKIMEEKSIEESKKTIEELKENGIDLSKVSVPIDMSGNKEEINPDNPFPYESSVKNLVNEFLANPEDKKEKSIKKFHIGAEYVTMDGTDKKVRTDTFINNN